MRHDPPNLRRYAPHPGADDLPSASHDDADVLPPSSHDELDSIVEQRESMFHEFYDVPPWSRRRYWR